MKPAVCRAAPVSVIRRPLSPRAPGRRRTLAAVAMVCVALSGQACRRDRSSAPDAAGPPRSPAVDAGGPARPRGDDAQVPPPLGPLGAWDGQTIRLSCPFPIDAFELPAWPECHVAQAIAGVGGLCPAGGQRCMRPCRLDVVYGDTGPISSQASFDYDAAGRLVERRIDGLLPAAGPDGAADLVNRWVYDGSGRLVRFEELRPDARDPARAAVVTQWSAYRYDGSGRIEAIESRRASTARPGAAPDAGSAGTVTTFRRDRHGRVVERLVDGRLAARVATDPEGRVVGYETEVVRVRYVYEPGTSRLVRTEQLLTGDAEPDVDTLTYGARGQVSDLETVRAGRRARVGYEYDDLGRLVAERPGDPSGTVLRWVYDCADRAGRP